jgi:hypothetical protein
MKVVTRINSEMESIRNSTRLRNQVEPKPKVGQANSATRLPTNTSNTVCKPCGETGHYSAKWANCPKHDPNFANGKLNDKELKYHLELELRESTTTTYEI